MESYGDEDVKSLLGLVSSAYSEEDETAESLWRARARKLKKAVTKARYIVGKPSNGRAEEVLTPMEDFAKDDDQFRYRKMT